MLQTDTDIFLLIPHHICHILILILSNPLSGVQRVINLIRKKSGKEKNFDDLIFS
jgi:hypothetical protein